MINREIYFRLGVASAFFVVMVVVVVVVEIH